MATISRCAARCGFACCGKSERALKNVPRGIYARRSMEINPRPPLRRVSLSFLFLPLLFVCILYLFIFICIHTHIYIYLFIYIAIISKVRSCTFVQFNRITKATRFHTAADTDSVIRSQSRPAACKISERKGAEREREREREREENISLPSFAELLANARIV